jgi:16S rRNA (cytidine1402-2'-O)-methyltransferase
MPGTLYVVATPIGNLEDISLRALRILKAVAVIAAEDTRRTRILLGHYDIATRPISYHEHNERVRVPGLIARLVAGDDVALVTDAGTPSISDPGFQLVRAAHEAGVRVEPIPGPSALLAALVVSGFPIGEFAFLGFAPARARAKDDWVRRVAAETRTLVFFDSPRRVRDTLERLCVINPNREVVVARELTKKFETVVKCPIIAALSELQTLPLGEITVVLGPTNSVVQPKISPEVGCRASAVGDELWLLTEFRRLTSEPGRSRRDAIKTLASRLGSSPKTVYAAIERAKKAGPA